MDTIPRTPEQYRVWWRDNAPVPYGLCWCECGSPTATASRNDPSSGKIKGEPMRYVQYHRRVTPAPNPSGLCMCGCGSKTPLAVATNAARGLVKGQPCNFIRAHRSRKSSVDYLVEDRGHDTPCWIWQLSTGRGGYGHACRNGRMRLAHKVYFEEANGPVSAGKELDHLCRVRACVNPAHLEEVSHSQNMQRGSQTKLNDVDVTEIRRLLADTDLSYRQIGDKFGVSLQAVFRIKKGLSWVKD